ncbi:zinc-ribbon domain-containing protein [Kiloniella litopenaei]|uniref:zinc-ribbon domain-containing protein n=1 Tax=Kiloniella litopenaei TaxID=1549748 RepID=UPI003BABECC7
MIVSCPECSSKFRIASDALGDSGRKVRCSSCRHTWFQEPDLEFTPTEAEITEDVSNTSEAASDPTPTEEVPVTTPAEPSPLDDDFVEPGNVRTKRPKGFAPDKKKEKKKSKSGLISWLLLLIIVGGIAFALADRPTRAKIVDTVPEAMKLYDLLGLQVYLVGHGLEIEKLPSERGSRDGATVIVLKGKIKNKLDKRVVVPKLIGWLADNRGAAVSRKTITLDTPYLEPQEEVEFMIELLSSSKAVGANTSFISDNDALQNPDFDPVDE